VYLNGSMLGMRRREIDKKFGEIVAFAEVERFLDTPVKRYSSGMYVRLAFAVAAHLEPEVLVIDEVLAVGDASFQKKSLGKMGDVARAGKTVLFVSHNMHAVSMLCSRGLLLKNGELAFEGQSREAVQTYLDSRSDRMAEARWPIETAPGTEASRLRSVRVLNERGEPGFDHDIAAAIDVELELWVLQPGAVMETSIHVLNADGLCLFATGGQLTRTGPNRTTEPGLYRSVCRIPGNLLNDGKHHVSAFIVRNSTEIIVRVPEAVTFMAHDYGTSRGEYLGRMIGAVRPLLAWDAKRIGACP
jgi:lipopolysaccharide transport system ATP-binding protein